MTQNEAKEAMHNLVGAEMFNLSVDHYYNPESTVFSVFSNYDTKEGCSIGTGDSWSEAIEKFKADCADRLKIDLSKQ